MADVNKERPIIFSAPMVRAILAGTKTQTRRALKPQPIYDGRFAGGWKVVGKNGHEAATCSPLIAELCPYGQPGGRLWVRESWYQRGKFVFALHDSDKSSWLGTREVAYSADAKRPGHDWRSRPSIHMPRWASRITLEITGVRVERLKDISEDDAVAEGIECHEHAVGTIGTRVDTVRCIHCGSLRRDHVGVAMACFGGSGTVWNGNTARGGFSFLWESINGVGSWTVNPWVWVVEFKRVEGGAA